MITRCTTCSTGVTSLGCVARCRFVSGRDLANGGLSTTGTDWWAWLGLARLLAEIVKRFNDDLQAVLRDPELRNKLVAQGDDPVGGNPQECAAFLARQVANWAGVLKRSKIVME